MDTGSVVRNRTGTIPYLAVARARVFAPIGLNLGGPTPAGIALAILPEIIAVRRGIINHEHPVVYLRGRSQLKEGDIA